MKIMHLYTQAGGVDLWRMRLPALALRSKGHEVLDFHGDNHAFEDIGRANNGRVLETLCKLVDGVDVVHVGYSDILAHTELLVQLREYTIRQGKGTPFLTDFDDDVINVPPYNQGYKAYHPGAYGRKVVLLQAHVSDGLSLSTEPLLKSFRPHARAMYHLPNLDHAPLWQDLPTDPAREEDQSIRLVFAGGQGRYGDLEILKEPLLWALKHYDGKLHGGERRPKLRAFFVACTPDWIGEHMAHNLQPSQNDAFHIWHADPKTYRGILNWIKPDIMVNPIVQNDFNRGKSCIKAYEAAHIGAAFLCTDWPTHDSLPSGSCLKVDNTPTQWKESLGQLIEDRALRTRLSSNLLEHTLANCQVMDHIGLWEDAYQKAVALGPITDISQVVQPNRKEG